MYVYMHLYSQQVQLSPEEENWLVMRKALCYQSLCYQLFLLLLSSMAQPLITSGAEEAQLLPNVTQYNCSTALLALNDSDYTEQGSGRLEYSGTVYEIIFVDSLGRPVICEAVVIIFPTKSEWLLTSTVTLCSLSIISCVVLLVTYSLFKELRTLPGQVIMNLAAAFLAEYVLIVAYFYLPHRSIEYDFAYFGVTQARIIWMSITGFEICRTVYYGYKMKPELTHKNRLFFLYLFTGWVVPAVVIATEATVVIVGGYDSTNDWPGFNSLLLFVLLSILLLTFILNVIIAVFLGVILCASSALQRRLKDSKAKHHKINYTRVFICLLTLLGFPWFLSYVLTLNFPSEVLGCLSFVISVPQPICMCVALLCNKKVGRMYQSLFIWYYSKSITSNMSSVSSFFSFSSS